MKTIVKGALAGGLVLWLWGFVFWALSGVPNLAMKPFADEAAAEACLRAQVAEPGFYVLPSPHVPEGLSAEEETAYVNERMEEVATGFFFAGSVHPGGIGGMGGQVGCALVGYVLSAALATWLLLQTAGLSFGRRVLFVLSLGVLSWLVATWPDGVWWGEPRSFVGLQLLDFAVGWTLAGAVLAWLVGDR